MLNSHNALPTINQNALHLPKHCCWACIFFRLSGWYNFAFYILQVKNWKRERKRARWRSIITISWDNCCFRWAQSSFGSLTYCKLNFGFQLAIYLRKYINSQIVHIQAQHSQELFYRIRQISVIVHNSRINFLYTFSCFVKKIYFL